MEHKSAITGAYALKSSYQKNMAVGFGVSNAMHITAIVSLFLFAIQARDVVIPPSQPAVLDTIIIIPDLISHKEYTDKVKIPEGKIPSTVEYIPVPDEKSPIEVDVPDQAQLAGIDPDTPIGKLGEGYALDIDKIIDNIESLIPSPDAPSFYDYPPEIVSPNAPEYPALTERAGIEGSVWIKAFIDKDGRVRDVIALKTNPPDVGFDEAAVKAAWQVVWKPAISNGLPVGVWITYKVEFRLK